MKLKDFAFALRYALIRLGVCLPSTCTINDLQVILDHGTNNPYDINTYPKNAHTVNLHSAHYS